MIVTLTANPSVDRTIEVERLERGEVLRAARTRVDPGGKGVNVARALAGHGDATRAVLPVGGAEGHQLLALLAHTPVQIVDVPITHPVRANVSVIEPDGTVTKLNEPGPVLSIEELDALAAATVNAARGAAWAVLSGSLPAHTPPTYYAELTRRLHEVGTRVALDTSGPALVAALGSHPDLVKPNQEELAEAAGQPVEDLADAVAAARTLQARGAGAVLASLGAQGAVLVDDSVPGGAAHASVEVPHPRSTVGAGDAALAGFLHAGAEGTDALVAAVAWGAAATALPGSRLPGPADADRTVARVQVRELHLSDGQGDAVEERPGLGEPVAEPDQHKGDQHVRTHLG